MKKILLFSLLLLISFGELQAQKESDLTIFQIESSYDTLWKQFDRLLIKRYELKSGISCLDTIRKKARIEHNDYQIFKADVKFLELMNIVNPSLGTILPALDSVKRTVSQPYRGLYNFIIGSYLTNPTIYNHGSSIGQTGLKHVEEWSDREMMVNAKRYLDTAIAELRQYADWPVEDFLFMTHQTSGNFYQPTTLFDLIVQTILKYHPNTPNSSLSESLLHILDEAIQLHQKRDEHALVIEYELQKANRFERNIEPSADSALFWKELDRLEGRYGQEPAIDYERGAYLYELIQNDSTLSIDTQNDYYRQSIEHFNNVLQNTQDSFYIHNTQCFISTITAPKLSLRPMNDYIIPSAKILLPISYQNIDTLYVSAYRFSEISFVDKNFFKKKKSDFGIFKEDCKELALQNLFVLSSPILHKHYTTDLFLDSLPVGYYVLIYHTAKNWDSTNVLLINDITVTNIAVHQSTGKGRNYFTLMDARTGKPLAHKRVVKAYDYDWKYPLKLPVFTNRNGQIRTRLPSEKLTFLSLLVRDGKDFKIELYTNDACTQDFPTPRQLRKNQYLYYESPRTKHFFQETTSTIITDRRLYRPGQTIYFKAYVVENRKLLKNKSVEVVICDKDLKELDTLHLTTNEFGTVSGQFQLPTGIYEYGTIYLRYPGNETDDELAYADFDIAEYKLPTFKVQLDKCNEPIAKGDTMHVQGRAISYTGVPVVNAKVRISISSSYWNKNASNDIFVTSTDENGRFVLPYKTKEEQEAYYIQTDVTDVNGETHSSQRSEYLYDKPFILDVFHRLYPETEMADSVLSIIRICRQYNSPNIPIPAEVTVYQLPEVEPYKPCLYADGKRPSQPLYDEQTYQNFFPEYALEKKSFDIGILPNGKEMLSVKRIFTPDSTFNFSIKGWEPGIYRIRLTVMLSDSSIYHSDEHFTIHPETDDIAIGSSPLWIRWLQPNCKRGKKLSVAIGTPLRDVTIYGVVSQGSTITHTFQKKLNASQTKFSIPTKSHSHGLLDLQIFTEQNAQFYESNELFRLYTNLRNIKYSKLQLNLIHWTNLSEPAQKEYGEILVTNAFTGEKEDAEMLVWMIDSSILDISEKRPIQWLLPDEGFYRRKDISQYYSWRNAQPTHNFLTQEPVYATPFLQTSPFFQDKIWNHIYYERYGIIPIFFEPDNTTSTTVRVSGVNLKTTPGRSVKTVVDGVRVRDDKTYDEQFSKVRQEQPSSSVAAIRVRKNFQETAFFYPELRTDADGRVRFDFTLPDQLTTWKLYAAAHTSDLHSGWLTTSLQTRQTLMVQSNTPRFIREGDTMTFQVKVSNLSDTLMHGKATLRLLDLTTGKSLTQLLADDSSKAFVCEKGQSTSVRWRITAPTDMEAICYRAMALSGTYGDGEEGLISVLPRRIMVTESKAFAVPASDSVSIRFDRLTSDTSHTRENYRYTLEATTQPMWSAILSLPYLIQYPYDCNEQTFSKFYANALAHKILNDNPALDKIYTQWRQDTSNQESPLLKNAFLKEITLDETPWMNDAQDEQIQKRNLASVFDKDNLEEQIQRQFKVLKDNQLPDGGWGWCQGSSYSPCITNHIVAGLQKLQKLGIQLPKNFRMEKVLAKMDSTQSGRHRKATEGNVKNFCFNETDVQYLYARTLGDIDTAWLSQPYVQFFLGKATDNIFRANLTRQAEVALILHRIGREEEARDIMESLRQRAHRDAANGMYWPSSTRGYYDWHDAPTERHALLMEAFHEIDPRPDELSAMAQWLLLQKQGSHWTNTKATTEAIFALLLTNSGQQLALSSDASITVGGEHFAADTNTASGTGQLRHVWYKDEITPQLAEVSAHADSEQPTFGALYWQYFEDMDIVRSSAEGLHLERALYHHSDDDEHLVPVSAEHPARLGERIIVRFVIKSDRDIEYVHLKDQRAAAFEPDNILSHHEYHNGLWYYVSPRNAATHFFFPQLSQGTHVLEYELLVTQTGEFSNGIATIECMYAPEYRAQSEEIRVPVK